MDEPGQHVSMEVEAKPEGWSSFGIPSARIEAFTVNAEGLHTVFIVEVDPRIDDIL